MQLNIIKFPFAIIFKKTLESSMFIMMVSIIWFSLVVIGPYDMRLILTVRRPFSKGRLFLSNIFKGF